MTDITSKQANKYTYFVHFTDTFMSGWGRAEGKINKMVFCCTTRAQVDIVVENASCREEMENIRTTTQKPIYDPSTHFVNYKDVSVCGSWYTKDAFKN